MSKRYQYRDDGCADPRAERQAVLSFPDLDGLTPVVSPTPTERVLWRLAAFYDVVRDHLERDHYPHPSGVWVNPRDARRLRRWVEAPLHTESARGRGARLALYWTDKGPASSPLVPLGQIIVTGRAYAGGGR